MAQTEAQNPAVTPEYATYTRTVRIIIMGAVMMGTLMEMVDTSIVNVAVPTIMGNLGATLDQITWVSTGYILASVVVLPMTGWLSASFGRRRYLAGSMALFTIASVCCGMSRSLGMLVFFRIVQGMGGAALMSTAQATMMEIFPPNQLGMVQSIYGLGIIVGPAIGPTLGGWITDNYSWPWIFYVNLPLGILATAFCLLFMHDSQYARKPQGGIDFVGIILLAVGLGSLQMVLEKGTREGWFDSDLIVGLTTLAVVGLAGFIIWELRNPHPIVNLRVLRHRSYAAGVIFGAALGFGLFGGLFVIPVFLQNVRHYTAMQTGLILMPAALASMVVMPIMGRIVNRFPPRNLLIIGVVGVTASMFMLRTITGDTGTAQLYPALILRGASMGFVFSPLTLATLMGLPRQEMGEGAAFYNLSRQLGGSAGIAFLSTLLLNRITFHYDRLAEHISVYAPASINRLTQLELFFMGHGASQQVAKYESVGILARTVQQQASILAYEDIFLVAGVIFLSTIVLLFFLDKRRPGARAAAMMGED
jgi:DHA2 family multidrug resistance protein